MNGKIAAFVITSIAIIGVIARLIWPDVKIDSITIGLLFIALIPWLPNYIKSVKLPGGWEIKFQDLEDAGNKIVKDTDVTDENEAEKLPAYIATAENDPNLGLVGLRIEIENRLRTLAKNKGIDSNRSLSYTVARLKSTGVLEKGMASGLNELILAGNQAAHGAIVGLQAANWAVNKGPRVIAALDKLISKSTDRNPVTGY